MSPKFLSLIASIVGLVVVLSACGRQGPAEIHYGSDQCDYCRMTIADKSFGAELISAKGKVFKYDSIECLAAADIDLSRKLQDVHSRWVTDFTHPGNFLNATDAWIVATDRQKSPMGIGLVAVDSEKAANDLIDNVGGRIVRWSEIKELVAEAWKI